MKYFIKSKLSILCGLALAASSYGVQATIVNPWTTIDFEELATDVPIDNNDGLLSPGEQQEFDDMDRYLTQGYWFGPVISGNGTYDDLHIANASTSITDTAGLLPYNGTVIGSSHDDIGLWRDDLGTFSIRQFDFAGHIDSEGGVWEADFEVQGYKNGDWITLGEFHPDGVADGVGNAPDFQTFCLDTWNVEVGCTGGVHGLSSVKFIHTGDLTHQGSFALDNIEVSAVPIPAAVWLFGSGLLGLVGVARRKEPEQ